MLGHLTAGMSPVHHVIHALPQVIVDNDVVKSYKLIDHVGIVNGRVSSHLVILLEQV